MRRPRFTRAPTVGIAIGDAGEIAISDGARVRRGSCTNAREADALAAWLGGEREALGYPADTRCVISLVPPLCELRQLTLPALGEEELRRVITREIARLFPVRAVPHAIAVRRGRRVNGGAWRYLIALADASVFESILNAARAAGWNAVRVIPAHVAWVNVACERWPSLARGTGTVAVALGRRLEWLELQRGEPTSIRRLSADAPRPAPDAFSFEEDPLSVAARGAGRSWMLALAGDRALNAARARARRIARGLAGAAALIVLAAGGLEWWGTARERRHVAALRAERQSRVSLALATRDSAVAALRAMSAAEEVVGRALRWSAVIGLLAERLPDDTHVLALHGDADSVSVDCEGESAAAAFAALRSAPGVIAIRSGSPIRPSGVTDDDSARERFTLMLTLDRQRLYGDGGGRIRTASGAAP